MWLQVLGSAAGGGFPQWNCGCPGCSAVRAGTRPARPRTQSSVAVTADQRNWFLLNASPDIRGPDRGLPAAAPPRRSGYAAAGGAAHRRRARPHARPVAAAGGAGPGGARHPGRVRDAPRRHGRAGDAGALLPGGVAPGHARAWTCPSARACRTGPSTCRPPNGRASAPATEAGRVVGYRLTDEHSGRAAVYLPGVQRLTPEVRAAADGLRGAADRRHLLARRRADPARPRRQDVDRDGPPAHRRPGRQPGTAGRAARRAA